MRIGSNYISNPMYRKYSVHNHKVPEQTVTREHSLNCNAIGVATYRRRRPENVCVKLARRIPILP